MRSLEIKMSHNLQFLIFLKIRVLPKDKGTPVAGARVNEKIFDGPNDLEAVPQLHG